MCGSLQGFRIDVRSSYNLALTGDNDEAWFSTYRLTGGGSVCMLHVTDRCYSSELGHFVLYMRRIHDALVYCEIVMLLMVSEIYYDNLNLT